MSASRCCETTPKCRRASLKVSRLPHVPWTSTTCLESGMPLNRQCGVEPGDVFVDVTDRRLGGMHADGDGVTDAVHAVGEAHHRRQRGVAGGDHDGCIAEVQVRRSPVDAGDDGVSGHGRRSHGRVELRDAPAQQRRRRDRECPAGRPHRRVQGPPTAVGEVGGDSRRALLEIQLRIQADADIAEVVMRLACSDFRHRHLGAQRRRVIAQARADEPTAPWIRRTARRSSRVGPGSRSRCRTRVRTLRAPSVGRWSAVPDATPPAREPGPLRCHGPAGGASVPR